MRGLNKFIIVAIVMCSSIVLRAEEKKSLAEQVYKDKEAAIRADWRKAPEFARLERERRAKAGERLPSTSEQEEGMKGLKTVLYNKAVIMAICAEDAVMKSKGNEAAFAAENAACFKEKIGELDKFTKLGAYSAAIGDRKLASCEMTSRDYANELRFPPYDFLSDGKGMMLFNFKAFNDCLLSTK